MLFLLDGWHAQIYFLAYLLVTAADQAVCCSARRGACSALPAFAAKRMSTLSCQLASFNAPAPSTPDKTHV